MNPFSPVKFLFYPDRLKGLLTSWQTVRPIKADVDATNKCNQNCVWCYVKQFRERVPVSMSITNMKDALKQVSELGCQAVLFSGAGEPLCNEDVFPEAFHYAKELGMKCALNTNGILMDKYVTDIAETCTYVKVSVDAGKEETYQKLHGSPLWNKVWENIADLRTNYNGMLGAGFLVHPSNYQEVYDFLKLAMKANLSYAGVRPVLIPGFRISDEIIASVVKQVRTFKVQEKQAIPTFVRMKRATTKRTYMKCLATPLTVTIGADMNVYACCVTRGRPDLILGNLKESTLHQIWFGAKRKQIIDSIDVNKCLPCKHNNANVIINEMKETIHKEFI